MFQIRIHGRGGQGVVSGAELLSVAAFLEGRHAQAFPSFGSERMGAPVMAFCRIDDKEIRLREPVLDPDALIIQDRDAPAPGGPLQRRDAARVRPHQLGAQRRGAWASPAFATASSAIASTRFPRRSSR